MRITPPYLHTLLYNPPHSLSQLISHPHLYKHTTITLQTLRMAVRALYYQDPRIYWADRDNVIM